MPILALVLVVVWVAVVVGWRTWLQVRQTGTVAPLVRPAAGSPAWWARLLTSLGFLMAILAPIAHALGVGRIAVLDQPAALLLGLGLYLVGLVLTVVAQVAMGDAWRGDVDPSASTRLVTDGPFRIVRNPIMSGILLTWIGLALIVPTVVAVAMLILFLVALEIQVRLVEEPYLLRAHGEAYRRYASRTGRFVPGIGRWRVEHGS
jgi:protein-S-isoprenylcysteine O-methyltransferase Ste14